MLAVTGAEALYADMGHFGRSPITRAWLGLVFPACILSYLGQGALILDDPGNISSPFFLGSLGIDVVRFGLPAAARDRVTLEARQTLTTLEAIRPGSCIAPARTSRAPSGRGRTRSPW